MIQHISESFAFKPNSFQSLKIEGWIRCNILQDCKPIPSLDSMYLHSVLIDDTQGFFRLLKDVAPNLRILEAIESDIDDECLKYISCNIASLRSLLLEFCPNVSCNYQKILSNSSTSIFPAHRGRLQLPGPVNEPARAEARLPGRPAQPVRAHPEKLGPPPGAVPLRQSELHLSPNKLNELPRKRNFL